MDNKYFMRNVVYNNKTSNKVLFYTITISLIVIIGYIFYLFDNVNYYAPIVTQFIVVFLALVGLGCF